MKEQYSKEETLKQLEEKAKEYADISKNCAQSTFLALSDQFGLGNGTIRKALSPFPGIALRGETCGAVVGGLLALGLVYGQDKLGPEEWTKSLRPCRAFCRAFEKEFGSTMCSGVLKKVFGRTFNLADPTESKEWQKAGSDEKCPVVVGAGCRMAAEIIMENKQ